MGPLSGLKVLDLSRVLAGPWATQILADLGAEVVKVERPGAGDDTRSWGPPFIKGADGTQGDAAYYLAANRNKKSLAIDIADPRGAALVRRLAESADVVVENFKAGGLARYGLDYAGLAAVKPDIVYCSITGFGQDGPNAERPGYDFVIQAMAGLMSLTGAAGGQPTKAGVAIADITTGLYATIAILAAIRHRDTTGEGQHIDMALFDTTLGWMANQAMNYLVSGKVPRPMGNAHPNIVPYQDFPTATRRIAVAVGNNGQFRAFAKALGRPEWGTDERYASSSARVANRDALVGEIEAELLREPAEHWLAAFDAVGVPAGPVNDLAQAFAEEQTKARGLVIEQPHPLAGTVRTMAQPMRFSKTPPDYANAPPQLGADSTDVLRAAGVSDAEIEVLIGAGVVETNARA
ncbi:CaiB/BaiF CoA transferase family protein [Sphingosinicella microcystinivorans]|uniref:CoA transferase n=1 Tax=Sphingosinicella microcystinivorans TaxID=335406 RepID=A0AAD1D4A2_SPHMI|nr:CaiB/BaiF CoA-transferase family protein [Sphingosinicella microcystinivorans]RKS89021.1 crotonobetainyl-CoA:carnitine CoA-transferase CaiB-like acyl-CoA transferase [Sphingosinicella microcystinivorans]BBE32776.1 CoA transferase [Sphingosinicella microcystinivorans]